jgi:hypothetical protein
MMAVLHFLCALCFRSQWSNTMPKSPIPAAGGAMPARSRYSKRRPATVEEMAVLEFEAWREQPDRCEPPSQQEWLDAWNPCGVSLRIALKLAHMSKRRAHEGYSGFLTRRWATA